MKLKNLALLLTFLSLVICAGSTWAQRDSKVFPTGKPIQSTALFCLDKRAAIAIAKLEARAIPYAIESVLESGDCMLMQGVVTYSPTPVYKEGNWSVYEGKLKNGTVVYEATDWIVKGSL